MEPSAEMKRLRFATLLCAAAMLISVAGCKKKQATLPPPPPTPGAKDTGPVERGPAAVINSFKADPSTVVRGESATLSWSTSNATEVVIDNGIGTVPANGTRRVSPTGALTYRMTAKGLGGDAIAAVTVNVTTAPAPPPPPPPKAASLTERMSAIQDVFFDYDKSEVREDARATLQRNADIIKAIFNDFPSAVMTIEGHCDERGSAEYNLGLGDRRSNSVREFLTQIGVPEDRLKPLSMGKERPFCTDQSEDCYQKNRRAHFVGVP